MLIVAFIFSLAGCKPQDTVSDTNSIVSNVDNSSEITSTEDISSTEETSSEEDKTSSEDEISSNTSSNTSSRPTSSGNSTSSKPSSNTSSTVSKPTTNTSSTASKPSQNTSSTKPLSWKEQKEAAGITVLYDENVKLYYYKLYNGDYKYEAKFDGINWTRGKSYSVWDSTLKMYYKIVEGDEMSYYDRKNGKRIDHTNNHFWNDKYYNGYWKIDFKWYTDGTQVFLKDYEYVEDTSVPTCKHCGKVLGNGTNGTCMDLCCQTLFSDEELKKWQCVSCNTIVSGGCHTCPDGTVYSPIDGWKDMIILPH